MFRYAKIDDNQGELVKSLRLLGYSVESIASLGNGRPDLLVGKHGVNFLFEVKDEKKPPSARALTDDEKRWHRAWRGQVKVVKNLGEILAVLTGKADALESGTYKFKHASVQNQRRGR